MGIGQEILDEQMGIYDAHLCNAEQEGKEIIYKYMMGILFWITKDDRKIHTSKLEVSHIEHILKLLKKKRKKAHEFQEPFINAWIEVLKAELIKRNI